ncbi:MULTISPECIES: FxsA family protein [unclassified Paenibacillus]|uniref:FxsA family protein n=1 Tax=Paenibacillus TaxID=44249 RepID=UPI00020D7B0D|nr:MULTISPECIES: FxsA family protein [unclassified Paenibacillus]EGL14925.1 FxsA cytoplasmic membrane protein [Paenibacillus sp. HGF7]EPD82156.1 hypothetical protein HMPREF1207_03982 [Paenibacillus sp. HGH0039]MBV6714089.1 FxsA family protein [Paenibacillus chitinolyticus]
MLRIALAVFIIVPVLEIACIIGMAHLIGGWMTFGLILLTGLLGALIVRKEASRFLPYARNQLSMGQNPSDSVLDSVCVFVGGLLLIVPGFLTDLAGLLLVLPFTRSLFKMGLLVLLQKLMRNGRFMFINRR